MLNRVGMLLALFALFCLGGDLNGKWTAKVQGPEGEMEVTYYFTVSEGKISGNAKSHLGDFKIADGTLKDDEVSFILNVTIDGETHRVEHKGKLAGNALVMKIEFDGQPMEINAKRN